MKSVKRAYHNKEIEIIIQDVQDETEYLLSSPENREHLLRAVGEIDSRQNLVTVNRQDPAPLPTKHRTCGGGLLIIMVFHPFC